MWLYTLRSDSRSPRGSGTADVRSAAWRLADALALVGCLLVVSPDPCRAADKVDVIVLENGDRIMCEVKELQRGLLTASTDALKTVEVYWDRIREISSPRVFELQTADGGLYLGTLTAVAARRVRVSVAGGPAVELALDTIVRLVPFEAGFWQRLHGHIDFGFSVARADRERRSTLNADSTYRGHRWLHQTSLSSQLTFREHKDSLSRHVLTDISTVVLPGRWFAVALGQWQRNQELSLELRSVIGGGAGRDLKRSNSSIVRLFSGVVYTHEKFSDTPGQDSPEVVVGSDWNWFSSSDSTRDLATGVLTYFKLGGEARARVEFRTALRFEFLSDFYFSVNGYDSYNSSPPRGGNANDYGASMSFGWSF